MVALGDVTGDDEDDVLAIDDAYTVRVWRNVHSANESSLFDVETAIWAFDLSEG
jgi:hypothetical protein